MSMTLTSGQESRMEGAPALPDPEREARVRAVAIHLLEQFGEPITEESLRAIMPDAERMADQYSTPQFEANAIAANRAQMDGAMAQGTANAAARASQRQAAQGVVPEDLPPGEFGVASGRTVQEANRPLAEAEAALMMEQDTADGIIRGLREGRRNWEAEGQYQFLQGRGEGNPLAAVGDRDVDVRRRIMQRRGQFFEMPDGTMIPVGREPTAADLRNERAWQGWVDETPGSARQARYNPEGYEEFREGARNRIREGAQQDMATYGAGVSDPAIREDLGIAPLAPEQQAAREARARSEDRVRQAQRGRFYEDKLRDDLGEAAEGIAPGDTDALERAAFRQRNTARREGLASRRQAVTDRARLRGQGLPYAMSELSDEDRADAIRGLIPNRNAAAGIEGAELGLKRDDLEARREEGRQRFEAMMAKMEMEAQEARQRADEARMRWEEEQRVGRERWEEETLRYREGREAAEEARRLEAEEREKDRQARADEKAAEDTRLREMPGLQAAAEGQVVERKQAELLAAEERQRAQAMEDARRQADINMYGDGVLHIQEGRFDTPAADTALRRIAQAADKSSGGFFQNDAVRMDAELFRLGVTDASTRHALVHRYGLGTAPGSNWWASDVDGRDNVLSGLWVPLTGGVSFPQR